MHQGRPLQVCSVAPFEDNWQQSPQFFINLRIIRANGLLVELCVAEIDAPPVVGRFEKVATHRVLP